MSAEGGVARIQLDAELYPRRQHYQNCSTSVTIHRITAENGEGAEKSNGLFFSTQRRKDAKAQRENQRRRRLTLRPRDFRRMSSFGLFSACSRVSAASSIVDRQPCDEGLVVLFVRSRHLDTYLLGQEDTEVRVVAELEGPLRWQRRASCMSFSWQITFSENPLAENVPHEISSD